MRPPVAGRSASTVRLLDILLLPPGVQGLRGCVRYFGKREFLVSKRLWAVSPRTPVHLPQPVRPSSWTPSRWSGRLAVANGCRAQPLG
jgi:hypothetical protein